MSDQYIAPSLDEWDQIIYQHFFVSTEGPSVVLCVDESSLTELEPNFGIHGLVEAVELESAMLPVGHRNPIAAGLRRWSQWQKSQIGAAPPTLGIVSLLVVAASYRDDHFPPHAYWHRLHSLRAEFSRDVENISEHDRDRVEALFRDLAHWSISNAQGGCGVLELRRVGGMRRIGLIKAHALLTQAERRVLEKAFANLDFHPDRPTAHAELVHAAQSVSDELRPVTRKLLHAWPRDPNSCSLVNVVNDHLQAWDGAVVDSSGQRLVQRLSLPAVIELQASPGEPLRALMRVECGRFDVADELQLQSADGRNWTVRFEFGSLSEPVSLTDGEDLYELGASDWTHATRLRVSQSTSGDAEAVVLPGRKLRFFVPSAPRMWSERAMLPPTGQCLIACPTTSSAPIAKWLRQFSSDQATELDACLGTPPWKIFRVACVPTDENARREFPEPGVVEIADDTLSLAGGVRDVDGRYFPFALPVVTLDTCRPHAVVRIASCHDVDGRSMSGVRFARVGPEHAQTQLRLIADARSWARLASVRLEAIDGTEELDSRTIRVGSFASVGDTTVTHRNRWGQVTCDSRQFMAAGVAVVGSGTQSQDDLHVPLGRPEPVTEDSLSDADLFVQVLASQSALSWPTAKRIAADVLFSRGLDDSASRISRGLVFQFEAMRSLGYLEIEEDEHGHFATVRSLPPMIHMLPVRCNTGVRGLAPSSTYLPQAVAGGTWRRSDLERLQREAHRRGVSVHIMPQPTGCWLVPDRLSLRDCSPDRIEDCAHAVNVPFQRTSFASHAVRHLVPPDQFTADALWRDGPPPHPEGRRAFDITVMHTRIDSDVLGDIVLCECRDPYSSRLWSYWLYDRAAGRCAQCPRQLGRWVIARRHPTGPAALPKSSQGHVLIPLELRPPLMVERAMCACSGLAPALLVFGRTAGPDWSSLRLPPPPIRPAEWLTGSHRHSGHWLCYSAVADSPLVTSCGDSEVLSLLGLPVRPTPIIGTEELEI